MMKDIVLVYLRYFGLKKVYINLSWLHILVDTMWNFDAKGIYIFLYMREQLFELYLNYENKNFDYLSKLKAYSDWKKELGKI